MKTHFIYIPFSGVGLGVRDLVWYKYRLDIFKHYTLKSLKNQTNKDFILWMSFAPKDKDNPLIQNLDSYLTIPHVFTYEGLMYWDDKFGGSVFNRLYNIARAARQCHRNENWSKFLPMVHEIALNNKNKTLESRLDKSLKSLVKYIKGNQVYLTRIDSDDMFRKDAVDEIQKVSGVQAVLCTEGYIYNCVRVHHYRPTTNPPFHTIIFSSEVFKDAKKHKEYYKNFRSHEDIPKIFTCQKLPKGMYCVLTHSQANQISTNWHHPFKKEEASMSVLKDYGITD